jgi:hypothetical protein
MRFNPALLKLFPIAFATRENNLNKMQRISTLLSNEKIQTFFSWALIAHACYPSYSGDRDQEDHGSKPTLGK